MASCIARMAPPALDSNKPILSKPTQTAAATVLNARQQASQGGPSQQGAAGAGQQAEQQHQALQQQLSEFKKALLAQSGGSRGPGQPESKEQVHGNLGLMHGQPNNMDQDMEFL